MAVRGANTRQKGDLAGKFAFLHYPISDINRLRIIAGARRELGPASAGASLIDNKTRKLFNYKPNGSRGFEESARGTFPKVPLEEKINSPTNQNLKYQTEQKRSHRERILIFHGEIVFYLFTFFKIIYKTLPFYK